MMNSVLGTYYYASSAKARDASIHFLPDAIQLTVEGDHEKRAYGNQELAFSSPIPGIATELTLPDGARFVPDDPRYCWPNQANKAHRLAKVESHKGAIVAVAIAIPLLLWWLFSAVIPSIAMNLVPLVPEYVAKEFDEQALSTMKATVLDDTTLDEVQVIRVQALFNQALKAAAKNPDKYTLHFADAPQMGANAFALAHNSVVVTDDFVKELYDQPDAITAVLLHEIGHIEHQHVLKNVAQSLATTLALTYFFGDIEGVGELVIGAGSTALENQFSQDMESQADEFAFNGLKRMAISPTAFADAMEALSQGKEPDSKWMTYLSSHPSTQERIEKANHAAEN